MSESQYISLTSLKTDGLKFADYIKVADRMLGNHEGTSEELITYVIDRAGHILRHAIDATKLKNDLGWEPSHQFE